MLAVTSKSGHEKQVIVIDGTWKPGDFEEVK
jgi:hypothetical protein